MRHSCFRLVVVIVLLRLVETRYVLQLIYFLLWEKIIVTHTMINHYESYLALPTTSKSISTTKNSLTDDTSLLNQWSRFDTTNDGRKKWADANHSQSSSWWYLDQPMVLLCFQFILCDSDNANKNDSPNILWGIFVLFQRHSVCEALINQKWRTDPPRMPPEFRTHEVWKDTFEAD